uniref:Tetraspanin n=1 Tax=Ciona intestinalis TaxID=7719 RepID=F6TTQ6_CIOIN|nr:leukocyte surface antigen CD53-like [Ciona intestinalis]|eukprot:XP_002121224.1 leukocyte surface antigen CD53-like [Ciona intestinalis]
MKTASLDACKYFLFTLSLFITLIGAVSLALGIMGYLQSGSSQQLINLPITILILIVSSSTIIAGFFGCIGSSIENKSLLVTFFLLVVLLLVSEIVLVIIIFRQQSHSKSTALTSIAEYHTSPSSQVYWDDLQRRMICCGYDNFKDWKNETLPNSCCGIHPLPCTTSSPYLSITGCSSYYNRYHDIVGYLQIAVSLLEIIAVVLTCVVFDSFSEYEIA